MSSSNDCRQRSLFRRTALGLTVIALGWGVLCSQVQAVPAAARVEEDWELVVNEPDPNNNGPQVTCTISQNEEPSYDSPQIPA